MPPSEGDAPRGADAASGGHARTKLLKLARMANQIATFFRSYPEEAAVAGVQDHILTSWAPRMRADLGDAIEDADLGLDPLVKSAFRRMAQASSPTQRAHAGPETVGELGSDAG